MTNRFSTPLDFLNYQGENCTECLDFGAVELPAVLPNTNRFYEWIKRGFHAEMEWIKKRFNAEDFSIAWVALWKYPHRLSSKNEPIAAYAQGLDYHLTVGKILREWAQQAGGRAFCDSLPIAERELAVMAGLGFIGRNTMLINPKFGSAFFIGGVLLNTPCVGEPKEISKKYAKCTNCRKCIDSCPNGALTEDGFLDSRKCTSYLTIEHRGDFTEEQKKLINGCVFGCDICQRVCPYNLRHLKESEPFFSPEIVKNGEWKKSIIKNTPLFRAGVKNLKRNSLGFVGT
ncbi:hypothetical protein AGMMS49938_18030 [Fibrobacterales bacterium]|nr:hypothetical protein AGMMS49938_18030 [Fibrobacterales bacterium]